MKNAEVLLLQAKLDALFATVRTLQSGSRQQLYLVEYLCVRVSGFIEQSCRAILYEYSRRHSHSTVAAYVSETLDIHYQNLGWKRLCDLVGRFDSDWSARLLAFLQEEHKAAFSSVLNNRHSLSHGESVTGLGLVQLEQWYKKILEVIEFVEALTV